MQEQLHQAVHSFKHLIGQNEWLNFDEFVQRIRLSEPLSDQSARSAILSLTGRDGIVLSNMGEITFHLVSNGRILDQAS